MHEFGLSSGALSPFLCKSLNNKTFEPLALRTKKAVDVMYHAALVIQ